MCTVNFGSTVGFRFLLLCGTDCTECSADDCVMSCYYPATPSYAATLARHLLPLGIAIILERSAPAQTW
jgi:hypothetical protein